MAFPNITPLLDSDLQQISGEIVTRTVNGRPWVREFFTAMKHRDDVPYILTEAQWDSLWADYQSQPGSFSWDDERDSPATTRTMKYRGQPSRSRKVGGQTLPLGYFFVVVPLVEA